jgi:hypothetical protein
MQDLSLSILELVCDTGAQSVSENSEPLARATVSVLNAMRSEGLMGSREDWVYQSIMQCMVQSGTLKTSRQNVVLPTCFH